MLDGWLTRRYFKDAWRLRSWTLDDYKQEGWCVFLEIANKYSQVSEGAHLMSLFQTSWWRHIADCANKERYVRLDENYDAAAEDALNFDTLCWWCNRLSETARKVFGVLTRPLTRGGLEVDGIVLSKPELKTLSLAVNATGSQVRLALSEILEELTMSDPIAILAAATGAKQKKSEEAQAYYQRLVAAVAELSDEEWNKLPREAQDWYNAAAEEVNKGQPVTPPNGKEAVAADAPAASEPDKTEPAKVKPISAARKARDEKRAADKAKREAPVVTQADKAAPVTKERGVSPTARARELMMLDGELTSAQVRDQLQAEGYPLPALSSLQAMRSDTRASIGILQKAGRLKAASKS